MKTIRAIYQDGVFRPLEPVDLRDRTTVIVRLWELRGEPDADMDPVYEILSRRHRSGHHDTAERHGESQP